MSLNPSSLRAISADAHACRPIGSRVRRSAVHRPSAAMMCLVADGAERRRAWRHVRRSLYRGFVVLTMALSLLSQQTGALAEVERRMYEPARISLRPGMFALAGPYQYHGSDRYETDLIDMDKLQRPDGGQAAPGAGRSTGFVHVGVRYYEPATGRFLQHDPLFVDMLGVQWGQINRWSYAVNDPVNVMDYDGMFPMQAGGILLMVAGLGAGFLGAQIGGTAGNLLIALGTVSFFVGSLMLNPAGFAATMRGLMQGISQLWNLIGPWLAAIGAGAIYLLVAVIGLLAGLLQSYLPCSVQMRISQMMLRLIEIARSIRISMNNEERDRLPLGDFDAIRMRVAQIVFAAYMKHAPMPTNSHLQRTSCGVLEPADTGQHC